MTAERCFICSAQIFDSTTTRLVDADNFCQILKTPCRAALAPTTEQFKGIMLCGQCQNYFESAKGVHEKIMRLERELCSLQREMIRLMIASFHPEIHVGVLPQFGNNALKCAIIKAWQEPHVVHSGVVSSPHTASSAPGSMLEMLGQWNPIAPAAIRDPSHPPFTDHSALRLRPLQYPLSEGPAFSLPRNTDESPKKRAIPYDNDATASKRLCYGNSANAPSTYDDGSSSNTIREPVNPTVSSQGSPQVQNSETGSSKSISKLPFRCTDCNKHFKDPQSRDIHVKRAHQGDMKPYECRVCHWKFASPSKLMAHAQARLHSQEAGPSSSLNLLGCPMCKQLFKDSINLEGHIRGKHEGVARPFQCSQCPKNYKKRNHLDDHLRIHSEDLRPFQCSWCNDESGGWGVGATKKVSFSSERKLQLHILAKHQLDNICKDCGKGFASPYCLQRHLTSHDGSSDHAAVAGHHQYICEICGASYSALKRLKIHQLRHENSEEPFSCQDCGKAFSEPRTLRHHRDSIHEKKFKYRCGICGIGCQQIYMLKRHLLCHSEEKQFQCAACPLKFKRKQQLIIHERKHTGERPFKCEQCHKGFTERKKLKNHEFLHRQEKPYECGVCSKRFALKHYLTHHVNTSHNNNMKDMKGTDGDEERHGEMLMEGGGGKFVSVEFVQDPPVAQEEVIGFEESPAASLESGGLVVGEWIQFGFAHSTNNA